MALKACIRGRSGLRRLSLVHQYPTRAWTSDPIFLITETVASGSLPDFCRPNLGLRCFPSLYFHSASSSLRNPDSSSWSPSIQCFFSTQGSSDGNEKLSAEKDGTKEGNEKEEGDELDMISEAQTPLPDFKDPVEEAAYIGHKVVGRVKPGDFGLYSSLKAFAVVQAMSWLPTRQASSASGASIPLFQGSIGKAEAFGDLVAKGVKAQKRVGWWLFGCAAWVFSMVVIGGVTRLTKSGLSMTDWKFLGSFPPMTSSEWQAEFEKYKDSPEYKRVNKGMSLEDFKLIYWIEYAHRMWGRGLGLFFTGPLIYFLCKGYITRQLGIRLFSLLALGAGQGLVGWWMVKSGLEEPESEHHQPKVSPYRLAGHLMVAFGIYSGLFWTALSVMRPLQKAYGVNFTSGIAKLRNFAVPLGILVGLTAASGAFVAGNDAGRAFNTFPKMGDRWLPEGLFELEPWTRNFFENTATVQLDHRVLALTTLVSIVAMSLACRKLTLEPRTKRLVNLTLGISILQVTLGISTLLMYVPVSLGVAHQAGALSLFTSILALLHALRRPSPAGLRTLVRPL